MRIRKESGFTLIELMITVAIVGILAAVAYPSYQNAMVKSRRASAQAALSDIAQRQQQFLMDNRAYAYDDASPGTTAVQKLKLTVPQDVSAHYAITIPADTSVPPAFTATATPKTTSPQSTDGFLSISSNGTKLPAGKW